MRYTPLHKAIIYEGHGADPARHRLVRHSPSGRMDIVAIGDPALAPSVARELARDGARLIEMCGAVSPIWRAKVSAAVDGMAVVSSVTYGVESLILGAVAAKGFINGNPPREVHFILEAGSNPTTDRFELAFPPQHATFIPVPDEISAADIAAGLAASGTGLIELFGGFSDAGAAAVIEAVACRVPVGIGSVAPRYSINTVFPIRP
jgi:hypothetical protein